MHRQRRTFTMPQHWVRSEWTGSAYLPVANTVSAPSPGDFFRCRGVTGEWAPCESTGQVTIGHWPRGSYRVDLFADGHVRGLSSLSDLGWSYMSHWGGLVFGPALIVTGCSCYTGCSDGTN